MAKRHRNPKPANPNPAPTTPSWWAQQEYRISQREAQLAAEEVWLRHEQTVGFPARCAQRERDEEAQRQRLVQQSQGRLERSFWGNLLWLFFGSGKTVRPLTRTAEGINLDREIDALRRTFHQIHERDAQWLVRQASTLRLRRDQLEADKRSLRALAASYGIVVSI